MVITLNEVYELSTANFCFVQAVVHGSTKWMAEEWI